MNKLFYSCKKATELIEKQQLGQISFAENIRLRVHNSMCKVCKDYQKQSKKLHHMLNKYLQQHKLKRSADQRDQLNNKILDRLKSEAD